MAAPIPLEVKTTGPSARLIAEEIYGHYAWLARWSDEIIKDTEIDLKKLSQLSLGPNCHCARFVALATSPGAEVVAALQEKWKREGLTWPSAADVTALRTAASNLNAFVTQNVTEARTLSSRQWDELGVEREISNTLAKPHAVMTVVQALRDAFEP